MATESSSAGPTDQCPRGQEQLEEGPMASLPDELLLHIFSLVADAASLLDGLPLVCRRWRALAADRRAWSLVDLHCSKLDEVQRRALRHAPAVRSLVLSSLVRRQTGEGQWHANEWAFGALCGSRLVVLRRLDVVDRVGLSSIAFSDQETERLLRERWTAMLDLLGRSAGLHVLKLALDVAVPCADSAGRTTFAVIAGLAQLETLVLFRAWPVSVKLQYGGELAAGLPRLRALITATELHAFLLDLVNGSPTTLRRVTCSLPTEGAHLGADWSAALVRLANLEVASFTLTCPAGLPLRQWPRLRSLTVTMGQPRSGRQHFVHFEGFLRDCAELADLRFLSVIFRSGLNEPEDLDWVDGSPLQLALLESSVFAACFDNFKALRPDVKVKANVQEGC